jgi:hypothetical protein
VEAVRVPQHLELNDVVAWGLETTDLVCVVSGAAVGWWLYLAIPDPFALRVVVAAPAVILGFAFGVVRLGERALREWLWLVARYVLRARVLVSGDLH